MSRKDWNDEKLFDRLLNNRSGATYWDNVNELRRRPNKYVFTKAVELAKSADPNHRRTGIDVLAQLGVTPRPFYEESIKLFFNILETEKDTNVTTSLLYAIGHNNDNLSINQIEKLCFLKNIREKDGLVSALLGIDNEMAIATLIYLSEDRSASIRNWATFGLGSQIETDTPAIREALWNRVNDINADAKFEAISGLAQRNDERITEIIGRELISGNYQSLLFEAITTLADKQFLPVLKEQLSVDLSNPDVNPEWIIDLKNCITELEN